MSVPVFAETPDPPYHAVSFASLRTNGDRGYGKKLPVHLLAVLILFIGTGCNRAPNPVEYVGQVSHDTSDFVEVNAVMKITGPDKVINISTRCVIGKDSWFIEGDFALNAVQSYWFLGTNVFRRTVITKSQYPQELKDFVSDHILRKPSRSTRLGVSYPRAGDVFTAVFPSSTGRPEGADAFPRTVWLAFCSGPYLMGGSSHVPAPINPSRLSDDCTAKIIALQDGYGLPERVEFFASGGAKVCEYEVLQSTNFLGRTLPISFRIVHLDGRGNLSSEVLGTVVSIRAGQLPPLSHDIQETLLEQEYRFSNDGTE